MANTVITENQLILPFDRFELSYNMAKEANWKTGKKEAVKKSGRHKWSKVRFRFWVCDCGCEKSQMADLTLVYKLAGKEYTKAPFCPLTHKKGGKK